MLLKGNSKVGNLHIPRLNLSYLRIWEGAGAGSWNLSAHVFKGLQYLHLTAYAQCPGSKRKQLELLVASREGIRGAMHRSGGTLCMWHPFILWHFNPCKCITYSKIIYTFKN